MNMAFLRIRIDFVLLLAFGYFILNVSAESLGDQHHRICREENVTFMWQRPENVSHFQAINLVFTRKIQTNDTNPNELIFFQYPGLAPRLNDRYTGRLTFKVSPEDDSDGTLQFKLVNVNPNDRGSYHMTIKGDNNIDYYGVANLTVYAEDNLWPLGETQTELTLGDDKGSNEDADGVLTYHYPFVKAPDSPVIGISMGVPNTQIEQTCHFYNISRCEIVFSSEDFVGLSGTVRFVVTPLFENDTIVCRAVKMPYDYKITIMPAKLSSTLIGGICVSIFVAIAACVIPVVVIYVKNKQEKYIPLKGGYNFLRGCIERIECNRDVSDVYRKNANNKLILPHVKGYFQDNKEARREFFEDEGLTKIYFAAFIKYYISNVCEPLIPMDYIQKIKHSDRDMFSIDEVQEHFCAKKGEKKKTKYRKRILKLLFHHFAWFRGCKITADGSDSAENSPTKILTLTDLSGILGMAFDRTSGSADMEEFNRLAKLTRFIKEVILHCEEIFGTRDEANGNITASLDFSLDPLLNSSTA